MPDAVLFRGCLASTATLADIIIQKFFCHMPHYRLLQQLKVGLNSYGYSHSHDAAYRAAMMYSFIATCNKADVNPREWLIDILPKL